MLDENPEFGLKAPDRDRPNTIWFNVSVPDIYEAGIMLDNESADFVIEKI